MSEDSSDRADRQLFNPESWELLSEEEFVHLCIVGCIRYGVTQDTTLVRYLFPLFTRLCDDYERDARLSVFWKLKPLLDKQKLHAMALLPLVICDTDQQLVSSATLDLLAYSEIHHPSGLPYGLVELMELTRLKVPRSLGYILGGLVLYGDSRMRTNMDAVALLCEDRDIAGAARCRSGLLTHAAIDFWLSQCEKLQTHGFREESRFGLAASALVNAVRGKKEPFVLDIVRRNPAPAYDPPIEVLERWSLEEYADRIKPRLQKLADNETGEKIIPIVMSEWGLKPRSR